ncbi:hypothetical protein ACEWY4_016275 [Coilia grayii]|uniref:Uncharacterized protein n=1 Tax=Coilia grayii TaxID=363190 RepID=A0ABD1JK32_9TELE
MPSKLQTQDIKDLHVPQAGHRSQSISRSGVNTQPRDTSGHVGSSKSKCRRNNQASPRRVMPGKVQKRDYKAAERKRRETTLQANLRQMEEPLDEQYIRNAAVLPDLRKPTPAPTPIPTPKPSFSNGPLPQEEPTRIHGYNVEDFKRIYHSVVDPKLTTKSGNPRPYGLQMGQVIKQRMWKKVHCLSFLGTEGADGRVWISESYCSHTLRPYAPVIDVDVSGEPMPEKPKRKRSRR